MARVLRPGGTVGLLWNMDDDRVPWVSELCDLTRSEARASAIVADPHPPYAGTAALGAPCTGPSTTRRTTTPTGWWR